ncbi:galactose oxidase [Corynespora cassiicola Philippines]|uniref:Galactose oxidase n=1 Tax=Corynespora cassiicola Philippines TaxID=1448308 RepID=A0A2T2NP09_CORCC|nr:galactose oxidase [Corynespora cassiicola Philippines]
MEPAVTGALYTAENLLQGAAALIKGITHPTLPLTANLTLITGVPLPRAHHTISVVKGRAYVFGGESSPGTLADNAMHIVILPSSGVLDADYTSIPARPAQPGGDVPASRKGHTAVVIGDSIYMFGGEGEGVGNESGRIWVYSTLSNSWSYLDPAPGTLFPSSRTGHASTSSDLPSPKTVTYHERAPQQPADPATVVPEPPEPDTWGTVFVVGGKDTQTGDLLNDALAFDVRTRTWSNIPTPTGPPREGASLGLHGTRLYRFGGKGVETQASGAIDCVDVAPVWMHAEGGTTPLTSGWTWDDVVHADGTEAPRARSGAGLAGVTTGQGRHYLLLVGGEAEEASFLDDIWAFQLPSEKATAALTKDNIRGGLKRDTHEAKWAEAKYRYVDARGEEEKEVPGKPKSGVGKRGAFAVAKGTEVDGASVVVWGGLGEDGSVLSDGWMVTVDR